MGKCETLHWYPRAPAFHTMRGLNNSCCSSTNAIYQQLEFTIACSLCQIRWCGTPLRSFHHSTNHRYQAPLLQLSCARRRHSGPIFSSLRTLWVGIRVCVGGSQCILYKPGTRYKKIQEDELSVSFSILFGYLFTGVCAPPYRLPFIHFHTRIDGRNPAKSFTPCYSKLPLQLALRFIFLQTLATSYRFHSVMSTLYCKGERRKT